MCPPKLGGYIRFSTKVITAVPIRTINFSDGSEKEMHDRIAALSKQLIDLTTALAEAESKAEQQPLERQIESTERMIDSVAYGLYGLTADEAKAVDEESSLRV